jgi:hypothetical protein
MLVYGDHARHAAPGALLSGIRRGLGEAAGSPRWDRADHLTRVLILAGELAQGVADAESEAAGCDDLTPAGAATMALATAVAAELLRAVGQPAASAADPAAAMAAVERLALPRRVRCRSPEGYAFYGIYPEAYAAAAATVRWGEPPLVIGIRSIGTSLAAAVAAGTAGPVLTVRPVGHPCRRELRISDALARRLQAHRGAFAVVDEGPGLSGSSFGAVADTLEALGVPLGRIVFLPSHPGFPGPRAAPAQRARWAEARRAPATSLVDPAMAAGWFADILGPVDRVEDISGGAWRQDLAEGAWPPACPTNERLKFRLTAGGRRYVARFAGLGAVGEEKLATARQLHAAGFVPEPLALRRGFLLERWVDGAPLGPGAPEREMVPLLVRYLGCRARLPACGDGASRAELRRMAVYNAEMLDGPVLGRAVEARLAAIEALPAGVPVRIDGRLHAWEWLRRRDGSLCKTDALDHAAAHDLVGCQDIAWDVAGAAVELGLSDTATDALRVGVGAVAGRAVSPEAVAALRLCYAAFQAGLWQMTGEGGPRVAALLGRYRAVLARAAETGEGPRQAPDGAGTPALDLAGGSPVP